MMCRSIEIDDPRNERRALTVSLVVTNPAVEPHGYGEHFDPGSGVEFEITAIRNASGTAARLSNRALDAVEASLRQRVF